MTLRVYQVPSPMFGPGHPAPYIALVHHRMVGTLKSTDLVFSRQPGVGRSASTTFGIGTCTKGHPNDGVCIHQYVRLGDQHWGNGNYDPTGTWDDFGYPLTLINSRTVSIEHEDNGGAKLGSGKGVITEAIWARSLELDRLLLSGDVAAMKAVGITFRAGTETAVGRELKAIVPGPRTILKHNDIAGKLKPYCLSPWMDDKVGFPRERFITELSQEPDMPGLALRLLATAGDKPLSSFGTAKVSGTGHSIVRVRDRTYQAVPDGMDLGVVQLGELGEPLNPGPGDRKSVVAFNNAGEQYVALRVDVAFALLPAPVVNCDPAIKTALAKVRANALAGTAVAIEEAVAGAHP